MALPWGIYLTYSLDRIFGEHWREWHTLYADDIRVHGFTKQHVRNRGLILEDVPAELEKPLDYKTCDSYPPSLGLTGRHFTDHGVRLSDGTFATLDQCMRECEVNTANAAQRAMGLIQDSSSAFRWPNETTSTDYVALIDKLGGVLT